MPSSFIITKDGKASNPEVRAALLAGVTHTRAAGSVAAPSAMARRIAHELIAEAVREVTLRQSDDGIRILERERREHQMRRYNARQVEIEAARPAPPRGPSPWR